MSNDYTVITKSGKSKIELGEFKLSAEPQIGAILKSKIEKNVTLYRISEVNVKQTATKTIRSLTVEVLVGPDATIIDALKIEANEPEPVPA